MHEVGDRKIKGIEPNEPEVIRFTFASLGILPLENHHIAGLCRRSSSASHVERVDMVLTNVLPVNGKCSASVRLLNLDSSLWK